MLHCKEPRFVLTNHVLYTQVGNVSPGGQSKDDNFCKQFSAARPVPGSRRVLALHVLLALQLVHGGDDARHLCDVDATAVVHIVDSDTGQMV